MITRKTCLFDDGDLEYIGEYNLPIYQGCVEEDSSDKIEKLVLDISKQTGMIQVRNLLHLDKVYNHTHNPGTIGQTWKKHHKILSDLISKYEPNCVFEIGGGHGILANIFLSNYKETRWTILDPNTKKTNNTYEVINDYFDENTYIPESVDMIVHSHFLEHIYNPKYFFENISLMRKGIRMVFSVPNLEKLLMKYNPSSLSFEHTYFCTEEFIDWLLDKSGFEIIEKNYYGQDHSIMYSTIKTDQYKNIDSPISYEKNSMIFKSFLKYYQDFIESVNETYFNRNQNIFLFGGNVTSQFLLNNGLDIDIKFLLDNDPTKTNKRLYGTKLIVKNPEIIKEYNDPIVIVKSGAYQNEVIQQLKNINPNVSIL